MRKTFTTCLASLALFGCSLSEVGALIVLNSVSGTDIDGVINPYEYGGGGPLLTPDGDDGFNANNGVGDLYATWTASHLYIGLRHTTLEVGNGMVIYINSPKISGGSNNPAAGTDQGEPGDAGGTPNHAESLITRANALNGYDLPGSEFADLAFAIVDNGTDEYQTGLPSVQDNVGLYSLTAPNSVNSLGFVESAIAYRDEGGVGGGLEFSIPMSALGNPTVNDTIQLAGFILTNAGFVSNETLGPDLINGANPGFAAVSFNEEGAANLTLAYVPEPSTVMLLGFAMGVLALLRGFRTGEGLEWIGTLNGAFIQPDEGAFAHARPARLKRVKRYKYRRGSQNQWLDS